MQWCLAVLELRPLLLLSSLIVKSRAVFRARNRGTGSDLADMPPLRSSSHMTIEEVEDVVRALRTAVETLDTRIAKQSMQEAFLQVRTHAGKTLANMSDEST